MVLDPGGERGNDRRGDSDELLDVAGTGHLVGVAACV